MTDLNIANTTIESISVQSSNGNRIHRSVRNRPRPIATELGPLNIYDGISRSEVRYRENNNEEDDELLFNMSMIE